MRKMHSVFFKVIAVFLSVLTLVLAFCSMVISVTMAEIGAYTSSYENARQKASLPQMYGIASAVRNICIYEGYEFVGEYGEDNGVYIRLTDGTGNTFYSTLPQDSAKNMEFYCDITLEAEMVAAAEGEAYDNVGVLDSYVLPWTVEIFAVTEGIKNSNLNFAALVFERFYSLRNTAPIIGITTAILFFACIVFLFCGAGHTVGCDGIVLSFADKIPLDLLTLIYFFLFVGFGWVISNLDKLITMVLCIPVYLLMLLYFLSFAVRIKAGTIIENNLVVMVTKFLWKGLRRLARWLLYIIRQLPLVASTILLLAIATFAEFGIIMIFGNNMGAILICWLIGKFIIIPLVIAEAISFRELKHGAERIACGEIDYRVNTKHMHHDFLRMGSSLNSIGAGLSIAVDARMRSEHFKTELITNVSHDIKTPLTSIINYVDLIKKRGTEDEKLKEYVDVLERQSQRLKKLIEDLMEASKASTGNIRVNMERCDLGVALSQAVGEYRERLEASGIEIMLSLGETSAFAMADGRHLWRIFDNLLNNVVKYAQNGTRLYISLLTVGDKALIVFRNISHSSLNISGDELMERFVRGDSSRHTEGSGLGLNIAKSLAELQNAQLDIIVDGDLFKTILTFSRIDE